MIETGYIGLVGKKFKWNDIYSYLPLLIRFFQSIFTEGKYCPYNHAVIFVEDGNDLYVYEADAPGVYRIDYQKWIYNRRKQGDDILILKPKFNYDKKTVSSTAKALLGRKYDFVGTLFVQLVQQITDERVNLGTKDINKAIERFYCSELVAYIFCLASSFVMYNEFPLIDPEDLYEDYYKHNLYEKIDI